SSVYESEDMYIVHQKIIPFSELSSDLKVSQEFKLTTDNSFSSKDTVFLNKNEISQLLLNFSIY
ncbi:MAG: hypothetical protein QCI00_04030, partial [Candidatus Thermoplasmatota archaeon]|nr:hypothetical protein [Candidatus Thermoplasmatota archaeon]